MWIYARKFRVKNYTNFIYIRQKKVIYSIIILYDPDRGVITCKNQHKYL